MVIAHLIAHKGARENYSNYQSDMNYEYAFPHLTSVSRFFFGAGEALELVSIAPLSPPPPGNLVQLVLRRTADDELRP